LLNKKKEFTPDALRVFTSWFERFSNEEGFMLPQHCVSFIKFTTGSPDTVILSTDARVGEFFKNWDSDADGRISLEDFLSFYREKSRQKPDVVWTNLINAKYGNDLKPLSDAHKADDGRVIHDPLTQPRAKITIRQEFFSELIKTMKFLPP